MKKAVIALVFALAFCAPPSWAAMVGTAWNRYSSAALESNHVVATVVSTIRMVCATNTTTTDLTLMVFDTKTVPADGAVTPVACGPVPAATATLTNSGCFTPPDTFGVNALTVAVSTGPTCFTKTSPAASVFFFVEYQ